MPETFIYVYLPILVSLAGILVLFMADKRRKSNEKSKGLFVIGVVMLLFPLEIYLLAWIMIFITLT